MTLILPTKKLLSLSGIENNGIAGFISKRVGILENGIAVSFYHQNVVLYAKAQSYTVQNGLNKHSEEI